MSDLITWAILTALMLYMALFVSRPPFLRLFWLWFALAMIVLEAVDARHGHAPWLLKGFFIAGALCLGVASYVRDECGQRTRYAIAWSAIRTDIARRLGRS